MAWERHRQLCTTTGRRLQISLAETYLQRNMYAEAKLLLTDLQRAFSTSGSPDYTAHVNMFCIWVSLARISHRQSEWVEAISCWRHALGVLDHLKLNGGFNAGIVRPSIAHALMMAGSETEAKIYSKRRRQIWHQNHGYFGFLCSIPNGMTSFLMF